jgi:Protein of unknown function (DUF3419)
MQSATTTAYLSEIPLTQTAVKKRSPNLISRKLGAINQSLFKNIHANNLIYNTCWEDPRCDRALLELDAQSRVVMITSAGCNALDYALDRPAEIHCVDMNLRQNALLNLKIAAIFYSDGVGCSIFYLSDGRINLRSPKSVAARAIIFCNSPNVFPKPKSSASKSQNRCWTLPEKRVKTWVNS